MNLLPRLIFVLSLAVLLSPVSAAESKQKEGESLIQRAEQISNIRSSDAHSFRLKASFTLPGNGAATGEGAYTEIWVSHGRWRRETTFASFHRIEVGADKLRWILDGPGEIPGRAGDLGWMMQLQQAGYQRPVKVAAIRDQTVVGVQARCVELKYSGDANEKLCIDAQNGVLLLKETPTWWKGKKFRYSCQFSKYEEFAGRIYPRHIHCVEGERPGIDVRVTELSGEPAPDSALFVPPAGAHELSNCQGKLQPPREIQAPEPAYPKNEPQPASPAVIALTVGVDGKPRDLKVVRPIGKAFDDQALASVGRWVFKPATCDGEPAPVSVDVEVNFLKF